MYVRMIIEVIATITSYTLLMKCPQSKVIVDIDWLVLHGDDLIVFVVCPESPLQEIQELEFGNM